MAIGGVNIGQELLNVPMGRMIREMALAIADAQWALDKSSVRVAEMMSGNSILRNRDTDTPIRDTEGRIIRQDTRVEFGYVYSAPTDNSEPKRESLKVSMMELGFTPTFYQFVDTIIEVKISISITGGTETTEDRRTSDQIKTDTDGYASSSSASYDRQGMWGRGTSLTANWSSSYSTTKTDSTQVQASQVNASYASKFSYSAEGSSLLRTKLVPVPPPAILDERIQEVVKIERDYNRWKMLDTLRKTLSNDESKETDSDKKKAITARIASVDEELKDLIRNFAKA